ncbi:hypothetical protein KS670_004938 [Vibrio parahaemolyticus]|nr:hypothetical protein [Vibrio parahaemolyticus]ELE6601516.1 hypothetical protein [Vibrio alginolyticus]EJE4171434.1 hypothetical protein [Vibrio parahaemolyticus]EJG0998077.1 hypothetical protein [Vibrio parahaemolyticus]MBE4020030.1 hypothetical protein [Vibrio parahaemolyticus]
MNTSWMTKIGEGLLIGLGASIAFVVFQSMRNATTELNIANAKLSEQNKNNAQFTRLIEKNALDLRQLNDKLVLELSKSNDTVTQLLQKVELLSRSVENPKVNELDFSSIPLPTNLPKNYQFYQNGEPIVFDSAMQKIFDELKESVRKQEEIGK